MTYQGFYCRASQLRMQLAFPFRAHYHPRITDTAIQGMIARVTRNIPTGKLPTNKNKTTKNQKH